MMYGHCICGLEYEHRFVEVRMVVDGQHVVLDKVPQGACPQCGSRVYKTAVLAAIESTMKGAPVDRRLLEGAVLMAGSRHPR
jgi:YgiT-type zinc finger domain-containing protein